MQHTSLSLPNSTGGPNEDFAACRGRAAVLLDGAGVAKSFREGCQHSVAWYVRQLGERVLDLLQDGTRGMRALLAEAIEDVADLHRDTCALGPGSPSATFVAVRLVTDDALPETGVARPRLEYLVLCDSSLFVRSRGGEVVRVTDTRVDDVTAEERRRGRRSVGRPAGMHRAPSADDPADRARRIEARRNAPDGFWLCRSEPRAAYEAKHGLLDFHDLDAVVLASDGATRAVDLLGLTDEAQFVDRVATGAGGDLLAAVRAEEKARRRWFEARGSKLHDDATLLALRTG